MRKFFFLTVILTTTLISCNTSQNKSQEKSAKPVIKLNENFKPKDYYDILADLNEPKVYVYKSVKDGKNESVYIKAEAYDKNSIRFSVYNNEKLKVETFIETFKADGAYLKQTEFLESPLPETWVKGKVIDSLSYSFESNTPRINIQTELELKLNKGIKVTTISHSGNYSIQDVVFEGKKIEALVLSLELEQIFTNSSYPDQQQVRKSERKLFYAKGLGLVRKIVKMNGSTSEQYLERIISQSEFEN